MKKILSTLLLLTGIAAPAQPFPPPALNTNVPSVQLTVQAPDLIYADGFQLADAQSIVNWVNAQNFVTYGELLSMGVVTNGQVGASLGGIFTGTFTGNYFGPSSNILFQVAGTNPASTLFFAPDSAGGLTVGAPPTPIINSSNIIVTPYAITLTTNYPQLISSYTFTATNTEARTISVKFSITTGSITPATPTNYFTVGFPAWSTATVAASLSTYGTNNAISTAGTAAKLVPWLCTSNTVPVWTASQALIANTIYQGTIRIDLW